MAKQRYINTKFWDDSYICKLEPFEKLLFIYLLTNPLTNIAGIYEISVKRIESDTGLQSSKILEIIDKFVNDSKLLYDDGWLILRNFIKSQSINFKIEKGIANIIQKELPEKIIQKSISFIPELEYFLEIYLAPHRKKSIRTIIEVRGCTCESCHDKFETADKLVVHHIVPRHAGGSDNQDNLMVVCEPCHKEIHKIIAYDSLSKPMNYLNSNLNSNSNSNSNSKDEKKDLRFENLKNHFHEKYKHYHNDIISNWSKETVQLKNILKHSDDDIKRKLKIFESNIKSPADNFWKKMQFLPSLFYSQWDRMTPNAEQKSQFVDLDGIK